MFNIMPIVQQFSAVIRQKIDLKKELSIIVVKNGKELSAFPTVEMVFNTELNLVEELFSPAEISSEIEEKSSVGTATVPLPAKNKAWSGLPVKIEEL